MTKKSKTEARRILALLTALLMVLSIFGTYSAFAEEEEELKPVEFDFAEFAPAKLTLEGEGADAQGLVFTFELTPVDDMIRFGILYATMAVDLICIGLAVRLNLQHRSLPLK